MISIWKNYRRAQVPQAVPQQDGNAAGRNRDRDVILAVPVEVGNHSVEWKDSTRVEQLQGLEAAVPVSEQHADVGGVEIWYDQIGNAISVQITHGKVHRDIGSHIVTVGDELWEDRRSGRR